MRTWSRSSLTRSLAWEPRGLSDAHEVLDECWWCAYRDLDGDLHGVNAWPATGADLKFYEEGLDHGQDD